MGYAGCIGDISTPGAWIMAGILYAWQFPHFNALSWNLRPDYSRAGYRMMAVTNPGLCRRTALRYTAVLTGLSYLAPILNVTHWWFAVASTPLNVYFLYLGKIVFMLKLTFHFIIIIFSHLIFGTFLILQHGNLIKNRTVRVHGNYFDFL